MNEARLARVRPRVRGRACRRGLLLVLGLVVGACEEESSGPRTGSNSNWLSPCASPSDCGGEPCRCGLCTLPCVADGDCVELEAARCATADDPAAWAQCDARGSAVGLCLAACQPGDCPDGLRCVSGACVRSPLPESEFCRAVSTAEASLLGAEERLLELLQVTRRSGELTCGGATAPPVPELRLDPRLTCAARVLARDLEQGLADDLVDAEGRLTVERLELAGYAATRWGEAYAFAADGPEAALASMAAGGSSCSLLVAAGFSEVGLGRSGDVYVVTLASPR